jgi:DNA invertase Pin-like site-specific DNA recombinase
MRVGYKRVSTLEQNTQRQLEGVTLDKTFEDKLSGKDRERPQLQAAINFVREGDTLVIHSLDRLARNLVDLCQIVKELNGKGVCVSFQKEGLTFAAGKDDPFATLQMQMLASFAQFERSLLLQRQREGIAIAKHAGKYKGRKQTLTPAQVEELRARAALGAASKADLAEEYHISRQTLYVYLRAAENKELVQRCDAIIV